MTVAAIRDKLYDYIRIADDKKVKAIYTMLEGEIEENTEWWKEQELIAKFDDDFSDWKSGKAKGYSTTDVRLHIEKIRTKRVKK